jgi:hypothetical protein
MGGDALRIAELCELWSGSGRGMSGERRFTFTEQEVEADGGWSAIVTVTKNEKTPNGSERAVGSRTYNFKTTPPGEGKEEREKRLRVKRKARQMAFTYLDPVAHEQHKQKRRKPRGAGDERVPAAAATHGEEVAAACVQHGVAAAAAAVADDAELSRRRDWALLRALKAGVTPTATWNTLASEQLIDPMDWSVQQVQNRRAYVCECVSVVAELLGPELSVQKLAALHDICS